MKYSKSKLKKFLFKKRGQSKFWLITSLFSSIFVLIFLYGSGAVPILYVNAEPVHYPEITKLIKNYGLSGAFNKAIEYKLIKLEAQRKNIIITAEERYSEFLKYKKQAELQGKTLAQLIEESGQSYEDFAQNVETTLTIYKLLGNDLYISEKEVDDYFQNNDLFFKEVNNEKLRNDVKDILFREKLSQRYIDFIGEAKANSDIDYFLLTE